MGRFTGSWAFAQRDALRRSTAQRTTARGIGTAVYYPISLHRQACFEPLGYGEGSMPVAEQACREVLALPVYPELAEEQIEHVIGSVLEFYGARVG